MNANIFKKTTNPLRCLLPGKQRRLGKIVNKCTPCKYKTPPYHTICFNHHSDPFYIRKSSHHSISFSSFSQQKSPSQIGKDNMLQLTSRTEKFIMNPLLSHPTLLQSFFDSFHKRNWAAHVYIDIRLLDNRPHK